ARPGRVPRLHALARACRVARADPRRPGRRDQAREARAPPHVRGRRAVREVAPPSGQLPPSTVRLRSGEEVALPPFAEAASDAHLAAHPDELERYGEHARAWCVHDLQWLAL